MTRSKARSSEIVDRLMEDLSRSRSVGSDKWTARCTCSRSF